MTNEMEFHVLAELGLHSRVVGLEARNGGSIFDLAYRMYSLYWSSFSNYARIIYQRTAFYFYYSSEFTQILNIFKIMFFFPKFYTFCLINRNGVKVCKIRISINDRHTIKVDKSFYSRGNLKISSHTLPK